MVADPTLIGSATKKSVPCCYPKDAVALVWRGLGRLGHSIDRAWKSVGQVEWETLKWVDWYNNTRLHSAIGYITPNEAEEAFHETLNAAEKAA